MVINTLGEAVVKYNIPAEIKCLNSRDEKYKADKPIRWRKGSLTWTDTVIGLKRALELDPSNQYQRTSLGEQVLYHFLKDNLNSKNVANRFRLGQYEFDIVLFNANLVIEHQSDRHRTEEAMKKDKARLLYLVRNHINILYVSDGFDMNSVLIGYGLPAEAASKLCLNYKSYSSAGTAFEIYKDNVIPQLLTYMSNCGHATVVNNIGDAKLTPAEFKQAYIDSGNVPRPGEPTMAESLPLYVSIMREEIDRNGLDPSFIRRSDQHYFFITNRCNKSQPNNINR